MARSVVVVIHDGHLEVGKYQKEKKFEEFSWLEVIVQKVRKTEMAFGRSDFWVSKECNFQKNFKATLDRKEKHWSRLCRLTALKRKWNETRRKNWLELDYWEFYVQKDEYRLIWLKWFFTQSIKAASRLCCFLELLEGMGLGWRGPFSGVQRLRWSYWKFDSWRFASYGWWWLSSWSFNQPQFGRIWLF